MCRPHEIMMFHFTLVDKQQRIINLIYGRVSISHPNNHIHKSLLSRPRPSFPSQIDRQYPLAQYGPPPEETNPHLNSYKKFIQLSHANSIVVNYIVL